MPPRVPCCWRSLLVLAAAGALVASSFAADAVPKLDARYPFRTDFANEHLPWYQPKPGEFPPHHSDRRISGELVSADFIHRKGTLRRSQTGELVEFTLPPYGTIFHLNAEADLRDVPLGTYFLFFLHQDSRGNFTQLATMQDRYSMDAGHAFSYRLEEVRLGEGRLLTTKQSPAKKQPDLGPQELRVSSQTRVWKGDRQVPLAELAVGDELLFNLTGGTAQSPGSCTDIWVGAETHRLATDRQREKNAAFVKKRGLPGWIDRVEGHTLTVTLFTGDPQAFQATFMEGFTPIGGEVSVVVANDELRTWNPGTDKEKSKLLEIRKSPANAYGAGAATLVFTVPYLLEGFRQGRIVRIFPAGWPLKDSFYGESLMGYGYTKLKTAELEELPPKEYPRQFPFRTDHGNEHLPWYQLTAGELPPRYSEHHVFGEVVTVDAARRAGQFRLDRSATLVDFTLTPTGTVRYLNSEATLADLPPGTRCRFHLYQDASGAFTRATVVSDEFSELARNVITLRLTALKLATGRLNVARQIAPVKNYNGDMEQPPDIGHAELAVNPQTRVWKGDQPAKLGDLAVGDLLLVNLTGRTSTSEGVCTDIWVGADTHALVTKLQGQKHPAPAPASGASQAKAKKQE